MSDGTSSVSAGEREHAIREAERAQARHEPDLRRLGAVGIIGIGLDPAQPTWRQWWARCALRPSEAVMATPLLAEGYRSADDALAALVELAARPRVDP